MIHFKNKSALLIHPFGIGDALFMTPVIRSLHESGIQKIDLLLGRRTKEIFESNSLVRNIYVLNHDRMRQENSFKNILEILKLILTLRKNGYDAIFDFSLSRQYSLVSLLCLGAQARVGFNYKNRGIFLTHKIDLPKSFSEKHVVEYYLDLLSFVGIPKKGQELELTVSQQAEENAAQTLRSFGINSSKTYFAVIPGGGESWGKDARLKRWPAEFFNELVLKIESETGKKNCGQVLILGGQNESELAESLRMKDPNRFYNLCGKTSLMVTAAIIKHAKFVIANDGGLVHVASALKTPVVAIFGPVDPVVYGPFPSRQFHMTVTSEGPECRPCYQNMRYNSACVHINCLNQLAPEAVFQKMRAENFFKCVST